MKYNLITNTGQNFSFSIPASCDKPSFFIFSLPKAGSTLLMQMITDVCQLQHIPIVDLATEIFNRGIQPGMLQDDINAIWNDKGYAYLGFRSFFPAMNFDFARTKNILLVRDPRDMVVSLYFSLKYSHVEPSQDAGVDNPIAANRERLQKIDIDQYVVGMAQAYNKYFNDYLIQLPTETTRVYRYEDVIFKKKEWLEDMLDFLNIDIPVADIAGIANKHDIMPNKENPNKHIRQVVPGNYKVHLTKTTINKLNKIFESVLDNFYYHSVISIKMGSKTNQKDIQAKIETNHRKKYMNTSTQNKMGIVSLLKYKALRCIQWIKLFLNERKRI